MAANIETTAAFATQNMKPDPGEQADALWAQKIADNTGYLYYRPFPGPSFRIDSYNTPGGGTRSGTYYFRKEYGLGTFLGSVVGTHQGGGDDDMFLYVNGVEVFYRSYTGAATQFKHGTRYGIGGLTNGNTYEISWQWSEGANSGIAGMDVTTWFVP